MSLRFWLPLTKDLKNQGLSSIMPTQTSGFTKITTGKLGGCYKFTSVFDTLLPLSEWDWTIQSVSFGCWAKISKTELSTLAEVPSYSSTYTTMGGTLLGRDSYGGIAIRWQTNNIYTDSVLNKLYVYTHIRNTNSQTNQTSSQEVPFDTWFHIMTVIDRNDSQIKLYLNGELVKSIALTVTGTFATGTFRIAEATWHGGNGNNSSGCWQLNDVRIYDHALSSLEVKQISQGLILHYPLNRNGWGQENLWRNSSCQDNLDGISQSTVKFTITTKDGYKCAHLSGVKGSSNATGYLSIPDAMVPEAGAWYTISADMRIDNYSAGSTNPYVGIYFGGDYLNTNNTGGWYGGSNYSGDGKADAQTFVNTYNNKGWHRVTCTAQYTHGGDEYKKGAFRMGYIYARDFTGDLYVKNIKFEKGKIATPWCPNSSDTLATAMGLNDNVEYDVSGYCNDGTRIGTFNWTSNTPKYAVSQVFNGTDNAIQTPSLPTMITDKNYTIAVWIYKTVIGSKSYQTIYGGPSGFELEARNGGANETKFVPWNWGKPMASYELNEWNHCVFVHSDSDCKIYLNGEYIATGTAKAANPSGDYFIGAWNTATQQNFDGLMSDFRIYATALSADDVKSLYNNSAYIDNQGNIYGAVYEEV